MFLLILIIAFIFILLLNKTYNIYKIKKLNVINLDELYNNCKTGDLLYFRWNNVKLQNDIFSMFTHIGMILEINNDKFIIETHLEGDAKELGVTTGGVHLHKLSDRIKYYDGTIYHSPLKQDIDKDKLILFIKNIDKYKNIQFTNDYINYITKNCLIQKFFNNCIENNNKKMFCSEFTLFCFYELGLIEKNCKCFYPSDFIHLKYKNEYLFGEIKRVNKNDITYKDLREYIHYFISFFIVFGGFIGLLFNNMNIVKFHFIFNIFVIIHWLTNNNKCYLSEIDNPNQNDAKYTKDLLENVCGLNINNILLLNIISYLVVILPLILSLIILKIKMNI